MVSAQETEGLVSEALKQIKMLQEMEGLILTDVGSAKIKCVIF